MATANSISDASPEQELPAPALLVLLASMPQEQSEAVLAHLTSTFAADSLMIASPDALSTDGWPGLRILPIPEANPSWTLTAADFDLACQLAAEHKAHAILMLGPGSGSLSFIWPARPCQRGCRLIRRLGDPVLRPASACRPHQLGHPLSAHPCAVQFPSPLSAGRRSRPLASHGRTSRCRSPAIYGR